MALCAPHPAAGTGTEQCETPGTGRDFRKAAMSCQSMDPLWLLSDPTFNTETNILIFFPRFGLESGFITQNSI